MSIEIIAIGDEILKGITINTNAAFLGKALAMQGFKVLRHTVLPDISEFLEKGLKEALTRANFVIATGGLGPTCDDITKESAAKLFNSPPRLLENRIGTAAGLIFSEDGKALVLLPGVPQEMRPMFEEKLLPILSEYIKSEKHLVTEIVHFGSLNEDKVDPLLRKLKEQHHEVDFGIYPGYGLLGVRITSSNNKSLHACKTELERAFADFLYEDPEGKIEHAVHQLFIGRGLKLALAESCTGGQLAAKITSVPGASNYFITSLVTYSNEMKEKLLGVKKVTLERFGAVSQECILEMAEGILKVSGADFGMAVSGIAGPDGGTPEKPIGTVWVAIAQKNGANEAICLKLKGSRETITLWAAQLSLFHLWKKVAKR